MIILGLDCSTKTGWCLLRDGIVVESGTMDFSKQRGESNGIMFIKFRRFLSSISGSHEKVYGFSSWSNPEMKIDLAVYEQAHHRGGAATEICVGMTTRVQEWAESQRIEYVPVHSATLKKFALGKGRGDKSEMIKAAQRFVSRPPIDDNEADAILLAIFAWSTYADRFGGDKL